MRELGLGQLLELRQGQLLELGQGQLQELRQGHLLELRQGNLLELQGQLLEVGLLMLLESLALPVFVLLRHQ